MEEFEEEFDDEMDEEADLDEDEFQQLGIDFNKNP